jgi:hypothetical protein
MDQATIACSGCGQTAPLRDGSYCSSGCRLRAWRRRRRAERRQTCAGCRREFNPRRRDARYCTDACRFKVYRERLEAKAAAERASEIAKAAEARRAADRAKRRADFIASLIG